MNKIKNFFEISMIILFLSMNIIFVIPLEQGLTDASSAKAISVKYTQTELNKIEQREITNPRMPYSLGFISESITPLQNVDNKLQAKVQESITLNYTGEDYTYGFIMILGRITPEKLQNISNYGVKLLGYHSGHSYKAKIPLDKVDEIKDLSFVRWIGYSTLKQKLHPNLFKRINVISNLVFVNETVANEEVPLYISLFDDDKPKGSAIGDMGKILEQKGVKISKYHNRLFYYTGYASPSIIKEILSLDFVLHIEKQLPLEPAHDESMSSIGADYLRNSYNGSGISVGIIDTGYDESHLDLPNATNCYDFDNNDTTCEDDNGHGTHVAGTLLGRGTADSKYKGVATGVTDIHIAKVYNGNNMSKFEDQAVDAMEWLADNTSSDIVSMSMGVNETNCNGTDILSREVDDHVYSDEQIYIIAAGNENGIWRIRYPGCAKNAITVGSVLDYGEGTVDNIWLYSSRGPTGDDRKKPDIVAPGCTITSTRYQDNNGYRNDCGTSMATPHVSGLVATLLQHYPIWKKNASTVKAVLAATALVHEGDISNVDNTYGHGKVNSYLSHYVRNNSDGWIFGSVWGEVNETRYVYYNITVPSDADRLVVVLTWTEPAASAGASYAIRNVIDLWVDKGANEADCDAGEWSSLTTSSDYDTVKYVYVDNPGGDTFRLKFCPYILGDSTYPQQVRAAYMIIRGDPTPSTTVTASTNDSSVYVNEVFTVTATVEPDSYVASGVYTQIEVPNGVDIISMSTTREDGVTMTYGSDSDINLGDIHESDTRSVTWTLKATTTGTKTINTSINSDNGGTDLDSINITVPLDPDGYLCYSDNECQSNYCDNDEVGIVDDIWCFTPYNTYFDGEETSYCEYSTDSGIIECDEREVGDDLNKCAGINYYEEECSSTCNYTDVTSVFECTDANCSCTESLCDGLTTGNNITTCSADETDFADKCTSTAGGEDRGNNICRSSTFASGCSADSGCNGVVAGTGYCNSSCGYNPPQITMDIIYPTNNINATKNQFFNFTVNVTCRDTNCGEINVSLDPFPTTSISKTFNPDNKEIIIRNKTNDNKMAKITLISNTYYCDRYCESVIKLDLNQEYKAPLDELKFKKKNLLSWQDTNIKDYDIFLRDYINETVNIYDNSTGKSTIIGTKIRRVEVWNNFDMNGDLQLGTYYIKIKGEKNPKETIDWIPVFFGLEIDEWATWTPITNASDDFEDLYFNTSIWTNYTVNTGTDEGVSTFNVSELSEAGDGFLRLFVLGDRTGGGATGITYIARTNKDFNDSDSYIINFTLSANTTKQPADPATFFIEIINSSTIGTPGIAPQSGNLTGISLFEAELTKDLEKSNWSILINGTDKTATLSNDTGTFSKLSLNINGMPEWYIGFRVSAVVGDDIRVSNTTLRLFNFNVFNLEVPKGLISDTIGATPFYTNESNPRTISLNENESQLVVFWVNATGDEDTYTFFAFANSTSDMSVGNKTKEINVSIVPDTTPPTLVEILDFNETFVVDGDVEWNDNVSFNVTVTDDTVVESVWLKIWSGVAEISSVIWQGFLGFVTGNLWAVDVGTNGSFNLGENNYTVYANDTSGNEISQNGSFTIISVFTNTSIQIRTLKQGYQTGKIINLTDPPTYTEFEGKGLTTNLSHVGAENVTIPNLILDNVIYGKIRYLVDVVMNENYNLDEIFEFLANDIYVNTSSAYGMEFNKSAEVTMYNLGYGYPKLLRNGEVCSDCNIISWDTSVGQVVFNVSGFSEFSAEERDQSKVVNNGSSNISFYLLMKTQYWSGSWSDEDIVINDSATSTSRIVENNSLLKLDSIWNAQNYSSDNLSSGEGVYRVYVELQYSGGSIIQNSSGDIKAWFNFTLDDTVPYLVSLDEPSDNSVFQLSENNITFKWTSADSLDDDITCNLTVDSKLEGMNIQFANATQANVTVNDIPSGAHLWNVSCWDDAMNVNVSTSYSFEIDGTAPNITQLIDFNEGGIVDGDVFRGENVSFNVTVTDNIAVESVWLKIWSGVAEVSSVIWQGFLGFVSGNLFSVDVETNESFNLGENNYTVYANDSVGNEVSQNGSFDIVIPNDTSKFIHKNSLGETVAWLGTQGNVVIEGSKFVGGCSAPGSDSLIIKNSSYNINAFINSTGDLCVKSFVEEQESCNPDADAFRIRNLSYYNMSYIDVEGDMCLTGKLYEGVEL